MLGFVYKIFLSRTLTTEMLGVYTIVASVFMVFVTILNSGIPLAVSKTTVKYNDDSTKASASVTSGLIISLITFLICAIIILIGKPFFVSYFGSSIAFSLLISLLPAILFTGVYAPFRGYLWGKEKFFEVSIVEFIEQIIRISCYFLLVFLVDFKNDLYPVGLSASLACILSTIVGMYFYFKYNGRIKSPKYHIKSVFQSSTPISLIRLATSLMQPFMSFLMPIMLISSGYTHEQSLSQLGIAMGMTMPLLTIPSTLIGSLAMAIVPNLNSLYNKNKYTELKKQISSAIKFTICCSFIIIPFFIALGEQSCTLLYNNITAGTYLKNCAWIIIPMGLSQISSSILNSLNLEKSTFKYYIYSCIVLLLSIVVLPKFVGIYALMYGTGLSMSMVAILNLFKINKTLNESKLYISLIFKLTLICIPTLLLTKWIYNILYFVFPDLICLAICGAISVAVFAILMIVFNILDIQTIKNKLSNKKVLSKS